MTENQTETRALTAADAFRRDIQRMEGEFALALPDQIPASRFVRTVITAVQMAPDLLQADRRSLFGACMKAAQDGLLTDGRESALVVYNSKAGKIAQYMPMIGGLLKKLRNSGELSRISAHVVYENDTFSYRLGDSEGIEHVPMLTDRGKPIAVYAIAQTRDGSIWREVMGVQDVEKVRSVSRARDNGPWVTWWDEMARKTVLRRLCKRLPSSADIDQLLAHDEENYDMQKGQEINVTPPPAQNLRSLIGAEEQPQRTRRGRPPKAGVTITRKDKPAEEPPMIEVMREAIAQQITQRGDAFEMPAQFAGWQDSQDEALISATVDWLASLDG